MFLFGGRFVSLHLSFFFIGSRVLYEWQRGGGVYNTCGWKGVEVR